MHIVIVGPGALGCLIASSLSLGNQSKDTVSILDYDKERAEFINSQGIVFEGNGSTKVLDIPTVAEPSQLEHVDVIFLCVKSYDIETSLNFCQPLFKKHTLCLFLQNGIGHLNASAMVKEATVAFGTTTEGATSISPGRVRHAGKGATYLGFLEPPSDHHKQLLADIVVRLNSGGIHTETTDSILQKIWAKLFINVGINAFTVIHDCKNGDLLKKPETLQKMEAAIDEAIVVAAKENIAIPGSPFATALSVCEATAQNISSMLQDVRKGRKTEIDAINGAIAARGMKHGVVTPVNMALVEEIKRIESTDV